MNRRTKKLVIVVSLAGALAAMAGGAVAARNFLQERRAQAGLADGRAAFEARDYQRAMNGVGRYVSRYPTDPDALILLARARAKVPMENRRHLGTAVSLTLRALDQRPTDKQLLEYAVELYSELGFLYETREFAGRLIKVDPKNVAANRAKISALAAILDWKNALTVADEFVAADPKNPIAHQLAIEVMSLSGADPEDVLKRAMTVLGDNPSSLSLHLLAARTAGAAGRKEQLEELLAAARRLPIQSTEELTDLLNVLERMPDADRRVSEYFSQLAGDQRFGIIAMDLKAERDWKLGRLQPAAAYAREAAKSPNVSGRAALLALLTASDDAETAVADGAVAAVANRADPADAYWVTVAKAFQSTRRSEFGKAREEYAEALRLDARPGFAQFLIAGLLSDLGERGAAIRQLESLAGDGRSWGDPSWRVARGRLVQMMIESGRVSQARAAAGRALSQRPALSEALGVGYASLVSYDSGNLSRLELSNLAEALSKLEGEAGKDPSILGMRAWAAFLLGQSETSESIIRDIITQARPPLLEISLRLLEFSRVSALRGRGDAQLHARLLEFLRKASPGDRALLGYNAAFLAATAGVPAAKALIEQAAASAPEEERETLQLLLAKAIESVEPQSSISIFKTALARPTVPITAYLAIVESEAAWTDGDLIARALSGLRPALGETSSRYRTLEARRRMTFDRSTKSAADTVNLLTPVVEADRRDVLATVILADALRVIGSLRGASDVLERAIDETGSPSLYPLFISTLQSAARTPDAERALRRFSLMVTVPDGIRRQRAQLLLNQGLLAEAVADIEALGDRRTSNDRLMAGAIRTRMGDKAGAAAEIAAARANDPTSLAGAFAASDALAKSGDLEGALGLIDALPASIAPAEKRAARNQILIRHAAPERVEAALRATANGADGLAGDAAAWGQLTDFLLRAGRTADAAKAVEQGLKVFPKDARLGWLRGTVALTQGGDSGLQASLAALSEAAANPEISPVLREVVDVWKSLAVEKPDWTRASKRLAEIVEKFPTEVDVRALLVRSYFNAGNVQAALASAREAAEAVPGDPRGARLAATTLAAGGDMKEALTMAGRWRQLSADSPAEADRFIAACLIDLGEYQRAATTLGPYLKSITSASPPDLNGLGLIAQAMIGNGQFDQSRALIDQGLSREPRTIDLALSLARSMAQARGGTTPAHLWLTSLSPSVTSPGSRLLLAQAWMEIAAQTGDSVALAGASSASRAVSDDAAAEPATRLDALRVLASSLDQSGDMDGAIAAYSSVRDQAPDDVAVLNNLAFCLVRKGTRAPEAVTIAKRVVELSKSEPSELRANYMDTLGQAQLAAGQASESLATFTAALTLTPAMPDLLIGAAECHLAMKEPAKAQEMLKKLEDAGGISQLPPPLRSRAERAKAAAGL